MRTARVMTAIALFTLGSLAAFGALIALIIETTSGNAYHDNMTHLSNFPVPRFLRICSQCQKARQGIAACARLSCESQKTLESNMSDVKM